MLKRIRQILAALSITAVTLLFLDFSGTLHPFLGWLAKIQFLPAVLALNLVVVAVLVVVTLLFGRIYCSVICPLGIFQDGVSALSAMRKGKKARFSYSPEMKWLRYGVLVLFIAALVAGLGAVVALIAPYSAYGRMVQSLLAPVWGWGNNLLARWAEHSGSYAFATREVWLKSLPTLAVAVVTLVILVVLAWRNGRTWCNTVCPVGTVLSFFSRFALLRPFIDTEKCKKCHACEKKCKASCIDIDHMKVDYSRCVDCFDCLENCKFGAMRYGLPARRKAAAETAGKEGDNGRRAFLAGSAVALTGMSLHAQDDKKRDGGFAEILPKRAPEREVPVTPFGSESVRTFYDHCTACQLCVAVCPNNVLRPSKDLSRLMQPEMSFEKGYCRPECVKCSEVCPAGAILKITPEEKTQWKVGTAHVDLDLCVVNRDGVSCGNCARHCPVGAIEMVLSDPDDRQSPHIPSVVEDRCIGCGACENLCPSRPLSAITVNGYEIHHKD